MQLLIVNTDAKPAPRLSANRPGKRERFAPQGISRVDLITLGCKLIVLLPR